MNCGGISAHPGRLLGRRHRRSLDRKAHHVEDHIDLNQTAFGRSPCALPHPVIAKRSRSDPARDLFGEGEPWIAATSPRNDSEETEAIKRMTYPTGPSRRRQHATNIAPRIAWSARTRARATAGAGGGSPSGRRSAHIQEAGSETVGGSGSTKPSGPMRRDWEPKIAESDCA